MNPQEKGPLLLFYEHAYVLAIVVLAAVAAAFLISSRMPRYYRGQAKGYLPAGADTLSLTSESGNIPAGPRLPQYSTDIQDSLLGVARSLQLRERVAARLPGHDPKDLEKRVDLAIDKYNLMVVTAWDPDPEEAARIANTWLEELQAFLDEQTKTDIARKREVLVAALQDTEQKIQAAEKEWTDFQTAHGSADYGAEVGAMVQRISAMRSAIADLEVQRNTLADELAAVTAQRDARVEEFRESSRTRVPNPRINELKQSILDTEANYRQLRLRYTDEHPQVKQVLAKLDELRRQLAEEEKTPFQEGGVTLTRDPIREDMEKRIHELQVQRVSLERQLEERRRLLDEALAEYRSLPEYKAGLDVLQQRLSQLQNLLGLQRARLEEFDIQAARTPRFILVTDPALPGTKPGLPNLPLNLAAAAVLGLVLGTVLVVGTDRVRHFREVAPW